MLRISPLSSLKDLISIGINDLSSCSTIASTPEYRGACRSNPVPATSFLEREKETIWRCILELIKFWFTLLCSIKGMKEDPVVKY